MSHQGGWAGVCSISALIGRIKAKSVGLQQAGGYVLDTLVVHLPKCLPEWKPFQHQHPVGHPVSDLQDVFATQGRHEPQRRTVAGYHGLQLYNYHYSYMMQLYNDKRNCI